MRYLGSNLARNENTRKVRYLCRLGFPVIGKPVHLLLLWLLYFFSFSPVWFRQWRHKAIANTSKYARWKNFSYNTFLVDVTLAVCKLLQKSCSNVNTSASAVPNGFLARAKIPIISMEPPRREMFFSVAKFLAHTRNKLKQVKTFVQCWLLEELPWNANVVGMSHEHGPHANFTRFQKNNLGYFWPRLPTVKVFAFLAFSAKDTNGESFFLGHFWPRITTVKVSYFEHFWPKIPMVKVLFFLCHF